MATASLGFKITLVSRQRKRNLQFIAPSFRKGGPGRTGLWQRTVRKPITATAITTKFTKGTKVATSSPASGSFAMKRWFLAIQGHQ